MNALEQKEEVCCECGNFDTGGICNLCTAKRLIVRLECLRLALKQGEIEFWAYVEAREKLKSEIVRLVETYV